MEQHEPTIEESRNDPSLKVSQDEYSAFCLEYFKNNKDNKPKRFGQAFCDKFHIYHDNPLYYDTYPYYCQRIIYENYIK